MPYPATIAEINHARGRFIADLGGGRYAAFTLFSHAVLKVGMQLEAPPLAIGRGWAMPETRQRFEVAGETGPTTLEECRRVVWG